MDLDDLSLSSVEDEQRTKGNSSMIQESDNEGIHLRISINENSTKSNSQSLQKYDETGHSAEVTKGSRSKNQNESLNVQEGTSSVCTIGKGLASNSSLMVGNENLETSQFMLSFASTDATWGSSSSDSISSDDKLLDDLKEISEGYESEDVLNLEQPILGLPRAAVKNLSNSPSTISFSGIDFDNESQTIDCALTGAYGSSLQEDSNSLKPSEICYSLDGVDLPSLSKGRLSNRLKSKEYRSKVRFSTMLASDKYSNIQKLSSNKNTITEPPLLGKAASLSTREDETSEIFSDCSATGSFYDYDCNRKNYCQKEEKSVRRKVKTEPPTSSKTNSLPNRSSTPSVSKASRKIGRSLLQISKSGEQISEQGGDLDIYETNVRSGEVKFFTPKPWVKEIISCCQTENADTTPRLDTEGLLKEVKYFFRNNRVAADENLSWNENMYRIVTSKYLSDEFSRSHGLLCNEELMEELRKDLERYTSPYLRHKLELLELCKALMECNISEKTFIDYYNILIHGGCDMELISEPSNREHCNDSVNRRLFSIGKEFDFPVMQKLYKKLTREGASFLSILYESKKPSPAEERFLSRELLSISANSSQVPCEFSVGDQSTIYIEYLPLNLTLSQNDSGNIGCPLSNEGNVSQNDVYATELSETHSRELKKTSHFVSVSDLRVLDSSVTSENESSNENTPLSTSKAVKMLESSNEQSVGKDGSRVSAEDLDSKVDKTVDSEE